MYKNVYIGVVVTTYHYYIHIIIVIYIDENATILMYIFCVKHKYFKYDNTKIIFVVEWFDLLRIGGCYCIVRFDYNKRCERSNK